MICKICEKEFKTNSILSKHITKEHNISKQEYYDKFFKKENEGICLTCGKPTKFNNIILGYFSHCCAKCSRNDPHVIEKSENTTLEKYGSKNIRNTNYYKEKSNATKLDKYGDITYNNRSQAKQTCLKKYGVENPIQNKNIEQKRNKENMYLYGTDNFKKNLTEKYGNEKYRNLEKAKETNLEKYGTINPFAAEIIKNKIKTTMIKKYGVENPSQSIKIQESRINTCLERYGYENPMQNAELRKKQQHKYTYDNQSFDSGWELAYYIWLTDNNISFEYQPNISFKYYYDNKIHYYCPDFMVENKFQEIKGLQFFNNGKMINPYDRNLDELYEAKYQCMITNNVEIITDCSMYLNYVEEKYTKDYIGLFKNNIPFPYPENDIIKKYHHSIYDAKVGNNISPIEAWNDKNLIYKTALNRLKYVGSCKPSDIIQGFNVAKIAPKVSVFKRSFAERLIKTYLNEFDEIFDPFSGFSGRMLGVTDCGKKYIGQDINQIHVNESNNMINDLKLNAKIICKDIFESSGSYQCLFTCSPYNLKEIWNENETDLSCDEWIDICLERFNCNKYLFVVDKTEKYKNCIIETIENKSHFNTNNEYVILIKR